MNKKLSIIVVAHKDFELPINDDSYQIVSVGNNKDLVQSKWRDDNGENISSLNYCFCELTALYWYWKNKNSDFDIAGLCHYRRYFSNSYLDQILKKPISSKNISKKLKTKDTVILPKPFYWNTTVEKMYYENGDGRKEDLDLLKSIIKEDFNDYYGIFVETLAGKYASYCNMMIMSADLMDEYCSWLFSILFELQNKVDITNYSVQEKRIFGYLSEILINTWVRKKNLKVIYLPMFNTNFSAIRTIKANLINLRNRVGL